jgi:hypothetical protein
VQGSLIIRRGFGFHDAKAITALAMRSLGGFCPPSPDEHDVTHGNSRRLVKTRSRRSP